MIEHRLSAPKADALPGCATPRTAAALRFARIEAQAITAARGSRRRDKAGTCARSHGIVTDSVPATFLTTTTTERSRARDTLP